MNLYSKLEYHASCMWHNIRKGTIEHLLTSRCGSGMSQRHRREDPEIAYSGNLGYIAISGSSHVLLFPSECCGSNIRYDMIGPIPRAVSCFLRAGPQLCVAVCVAWVIATRLVRWDATADFPDTTKATGSATFVVGLKRTVIAILTAFNR